MMKHWSRICQVLLRAHNVRLSDVPPRPHARSVCHVKHSAAQPTSHQNARKLAKIPFLSQSISATTGRISPASHVPVYDLQSLGINCRTFLRSHIVPHTSPTPLIGHRHGPEHPLLRPALADERLHPPPALPASPHVPRPIRRPLRPPVGPAAIKPDHEKRLPFLPFPGVFIVSLWK